MLLGVLQGVLLCVLLCVQQGVEGALLQGAQLQGAPQLQAVMRCLQLHALLQAEAEACPGQQQQP